MRGRKKEEEEGEEEEGRKKKKKKSAAVSLLYSSCSTGLEGQKLPLTGRMAAISTQPMCHYRVLAKLPHTPPSSSPPPHPPHGLIRITQFMEISVWCVEEEIARQWFMLSVITLITPRGCDTCSCSFGHYLYISMFHVCVVALQPFCDVSPSSGPSAQSDHSNTGAAIQMLSANEVIEAKNSATKRI